MTQKPSQNRQKKRKTDRRDVGPHSLSLDVTVRTDTHPGAVPSEQRSCSGAGRALPGSLGVEPLIHADRWTITNKIPPKNFLKLNT